MLIQIGSLFIGWGEVRLVGKTAVVTQVKTYPEPTWGAWGAEEDLTGTATFVPRITFF